MFRAAHTYVCLEEKSPLYALSGCSTLKDIVVEITKNAVMLSEKPFGSHNYLSGSVFVSVRIIHF